MREHLQRRPREDVTVLDVHHLVSDVVDDGQTLQAPRLFLATTRVLGGDHNVLVCRGKEGEGS